MEALRTSADTLFILLGAVMVLAMHAGFAFLELGTVRKKNQVNALVKILVDFAVSTIAYFFIGYTIAYGVHFFAGAETLAAHERLRARAILLPADVRRRDPGDRLGRHRRARAVQSAARRDVRAGRLRLSVLRRHRVERALRHSRAGSSGAFGAPFHDFAGSRRRACVRRLDRARRRCCCSARATAATRKDGGIAAHPPSIIPFLALGAWVLSVGWFGFNVMSAQTIDKISGLVAVNSLMAMVGGTLAALVAGRNDPGLRPQRAARGTGRDLRGLGRHASDRRARHRRARGRAVRRACSRCTQNRWRIDDVLGVWPLHGLCGAWGGIAAGIFGAKALGGIGGVSFGSQIAGTVLGIVIAVVGAGSSTAR